jgi:hypothetical protein
MNPLVRVWAKRRLATVKSPAKRVAIMVPLISVTLNEDEAISMRHLREFLGGYDKFLLVPEGLDVRMDGFTALPLDQKHFGSAANHNRMLYRTDFWEKFADYEYVLMYHLDALVFSDQLEEWCDRELDFIGAPFLRCPESPWVREERVGNGGFALYRVPSVLKVLWSRYIGDPSKFWEDHFWREREKLRSFLRPIRSAVPGWLRGRATSGLRSQLKKIDRTEVNERGNDLFWSDEAKRHWPPFKVGTLEEGLAFAFETQPSRSLERMGGKLPFGCHAWGRYDRGFWEKYLLTSDDPDEPEGMALG